MAVATGGGGGQGRPAQPTSLLVLLPKGRGGHEADKPGGRAFCVLGLSLISPFPMTGSGRCSVNEPKWEGRLTAASRVLSGAAVLEGGAAVTS